MAKRIRISLAVKFRLLFGLALLAVIAAALAVPWYFMEVLSEQSLESPASEITRLRLNEWLQSAGEENKHLDDAESNVLATYKLGDSPQRAGLKGPSFVKLDPQNPAESLAQDAPAQNALRVFLENPDRELAWLKTTPPNRNEAVYRCFRAVRNTAKCAVCHTDSAMRPELQFQRNQLVGLIEVDLPESAASGTLLWYTRGAILAGGFIAGVLALVVFAAISNRLVLRPVRKLREVADRVTEGDMTVRSNVRTGDELQRLGESVNEMLEAIQDQHNKLRTANRALDLKLNELGEVNVALYEANQVKTEFLANVSHELRTPLNSIIGFADLLCGSEDEKTARFGRNISTAAKNLLNMINDMLNLAKIEAGRAQVRYDKVSVLDTCQTLAALMQPLADKKNIRLETRLDESLPLVTTDGGKLQQILYNLMSNAVKFTPPGGDVRLEAETIPAGNGRNRQAVRIAVSDSGPGISEADRAYIFEKFYQVDPTLTKEASGAGLGLAICKELSNLLGGKLDLESEPGHGTTFFLTLPVEPPDDQ